MAWHAAAAPDSSPEIVCPQIVSTDLEVLWLLAEWLFVIFDTAGEVTFAGVSESANQRVERALSVDRG
jgi:hypothetical protein